MNIQPSKLSVTLPNLTRRKAIGPFTVYERTPKPKGSTRYCVFKGDDWVQDNGRYATAVRFCKQQVPKAPVNVVVNMGQKTAASDAPATIMIIDGPYRNTTKAVVAPDFVRDAIDGGDSEPS